MTNQYNSFLYTYFICLPPGHKVCMESSPQRHSAKGVFQIHPPVSGVNFSNKMSIPQVGVKIRKTKHGTTFNSLNY